MDLAAIHLGHIAALALKALSFAARPWTRAKDVFTPDSSDMIPAISGLIVMVMFSCYANFFSRFNATVPAVSFLSKLNAGSLKIEIASSAIASIHLRQIVLNADR